MTAADRQMTRDFVRLGREAQRERDRDKLIELLLERGRVFFDALTSGSGLDLPLDELKECLEREVDLLSRLNDERQKLLAEMEELSKNRSATQKYRAKFPFPPLPVFFDTTT